MACLASQKPRDTQASTNIHCDLSTYSFLHKHEPPIYLLQKKLLDFLEQQKPNNSGKQIARFQQNTERNECTKHQNASA